MVLVLINWTVLVWLDWFCLFAPLWVLGRLVRSYSDRTCLFESEYDLGQFVLGRHESVVLTRSGSRVNVF